MTEDSLLDPPSAKPLWLWTLADLALLLVGFFVLIQATDRRALANGLRQGFGGKAVAIVAEPDAIPLASAAVAFPAGSAVPDNAADLLGWAKSSAVDPRVTLRIVGSTDRSPSDIDPATRSAVLLAADRARAVAAYLIANGVAADRIAIGAPATGRRGVLVTIGFTGVSSTTTGPDGKQP
jgi:hypothetical protein